MKNPHGLFCNQYNYPWAFNGVSSDCACSDEWRKAFWNLVRGFYWRVVISDKEEIGTDLQLGDVSSARTCWLPNPDGIYVTGNRGKKRILKC